METLTDQAHRARTAEWILNTIGKMLLASVAAPCAVALAAAILLPMAEREWVELSVILAGPLAAGLVLFAAAAPHQLTPDLVDIDAEAD